MYTVITVILNANGFAIGSVVSLRWNQGNLSESQFRESIILAAAHSVFHQVFLISLIIRSHQIAFDILETV